MSETVEEKARTWGSFWGRVDADASIEPITTYQVGQSAVASAKEKAESIDPKIEASDLSAWTEAYVPIYIQSYKLAAGSRVIPGKYFSLRDLLESIKQGNETASSLRCHIKLGDMDELIVYHNTNGEILLQEYCPDALIAALAELGIKEQRINKGSRK